jgi:plasmid maintenance system antidote protein VapI
MTNRGKVVSDEILTLSDVAKDLHCSKSQVSNLVNGKVRGVPPLPAIPLGRRLLVRRSSLEAWKRQSERAIAGDMLASSPKPTVVDA